MRRTSTLYFCVLIALCGILPAFSQDTIVAIKDVTVYGLSRQHIQSRVTEEIQASDLKNAFGSTLAATLEKIKGISSIQNGATIAKPVIQGMHSNRILIINNGVRQQGQQWGDDHAPELDMNTAERVSVIKGSESVKYGSDAMGGVILLQPRPLPYGKKGLHGSLVTSFNSNGLRYGFTGFAEGRLLSRDDWAWRLQATYANAGDRSTPDYLLNNTGMREKALSAAVGWKKRTHGAELYYSFYHTLLGVMYSAHLGNIDLLKERLKYGRPVETYPFSRHIDYPYQDVTHHLLKLNAYYFLNNGSKLSLQYAFQHDLRDEFHQRRNNRSSTPSLSLRLQTSQLDFTWQNSYGNWSTEAGFFLGNMNNQNVPGTGVVPIIPNYTQDNFGIYLIQNYASQNRLFFNAGLRYDYQMTNSRGMDIYSTAYGSKRHFNNFVYNAGVLYKPVEQLSLKSNVGIAWRAPNVHELYSNGLDHASSIYIIGDSTMQSERSLKWIAGAEWSQEKFSFSVEGYLQWFNHFIYDEPTRQFMTVISGAYPVFVYRQLNAFFRGVDAELTVKPIRQMEYRAMAGMVWANETYTHRYLPGIPSFRFNHSLKYTWDRLHRFQGVFVEINHKYVGKQKRFDPETDLIDYTPDAYSLCGLSAGCKMPLGNQSLSLSVQADNIFDTVYKEYTNRYRYYAHDLGRNIKMTAIFSF